MLNYQRVHTKLELVLMVGNIDVLSFCLLRVDSWMGGQHATRRPLVFGTVKKTGDTVLFLPSVSSNQPCEISQLTKLGVEPSTGRGSSD